MSKDGIKLESQRWPRWLVVAALISIAGILILTVALNRPGRSVFPPVPQPNGYDLLCAAAARLEADGVIPNRTGARTNDLAAVIQTNQEALAEIQKALEVPGAVPLKVGTEWFEGHLRELTAIKKAAWVIDAQASLRSMEGDIPGALKATLTLFRLSEMAGKGGLVTDNLMGLACEGIARDRLSRLLPHLNAADARLALEALGHHEGRRESLKAIEDRDYEWSQHSYGWFQQVRARLARTLRPAAATAWRPRALARITQNRILLLRLAKHAYTLEHGRDPTSVSDLVPAYLTEPPLDAVTQQPLPLE